MASQLTIYGPSTQSPSRPMPTAIKRTKFTKTRATKKRSGVNVSLVRLGRNPIPLRISNTMRYVETASVSIAIGAMQTYSFKANGMFDPNQSGTGHQPLYYDQLMTLYDHYCVTASKCTWTLTAPASDYAIQIATCIEDDTTLTVTNPAFVGERTGAKFQMWNPNSGTQLPSWTTYWNSYKTFGANPIANPNMQGLVGSDPLEQSFFLISISDASLNTFTCYLNVQIEYQVQFTEIASVVSS